MRLTLIACAVVTVVSAVSIREREQRNTTYNVVSLEGGGGGEQQDVSVIVDNKTYPLVPSEEIPILYTGSAPVATNGYSYAISSGQNNTKVEPFTRNPTNEPATPNETFGRSWNTKNISKLEPVYPHIRAMDRLETPIHIDGEIPTIYISGNQTDFDYMHENVFDEITVKANFSYISPKDTQVINNIDFELAGRSSRWFPKVSYNIKLKKDEEDELYNYRRLKLRALPNDDSYLREKLGYDVIEAVGLATTKFSFVRVVLNDQPLGLYGLIETFKDPWLQNEFAHGDENYENGPLYQGSYLSPVSSREGLISDLSYYGDNITKYELGQYKIKEDPAKGEPSFQLLMDFTKFISEAPTNTSDAVEVWQKTFDTDSFLRSMALEVLLGFSDGYAATADNYYIYYEPNSSRYIYIPSDIDMTFGSGYLNFSAMTSGNYSTFPGLYSRPLITKMLQVPGFKTQFEDMLLEITQKLFNPEKLNPHIDQLAEMIAVDVEWDKTLPRVSKNLFFAGAENQGLVDMVPSNMDRNTALDFYHRIGNPVPLEVAIEGPTGYISLPGLKEFIKIQSENTLNFFNKKNP
ncbi:coth protein-domain-containing protein [Phycomyces blakesleeanus]|uniref:Secreted coth spore-coat protein domain-containing protein n=2 Tax=Phycomyces blakesleeanus TaxID=4837 RepID=A0A167PWM4_PHYB8|nr:hypothetical protein PHYBLDRAFT_140728 [Phycomyces blakesleeanus NRRL 1555(-)]OAD78668.1 hypothetical protein PHYBLDRAFT_140728 [Phycomyces blakesleeanus NRRL 1555(-)]|eukprot:XP_018296708.1 hypothetical protein PHYBLDRAFT_140728 [Phycomyces blakesleeanus NRRL 1555(-)]